MVQNISGKKILLGVCGGVSVYKVVELARLMQQSGAEVKVVMTTAAQDFIGAQTFQAVTGNPVAIETNDSSFERSMAHIDLSRWADMFVIAPATANFMAKLAHGLADDLLSLICLMFDKPIMVCPAMNVHMWQHPATVANYECLKSRGILFIGPDAGEQACGDVGVGRLREPQFILNALEYHSLYLTMSDSSFVVTAGPTREAIDPVRFISNHSSGLMGYSLAEVLAFAGAKVTLISGPTHLSSPPGVHVISVQSCTEMHQAVFDSLQPGDIYVGVAAVSDYTISEPQLNKIKKSQSEYLNLQFQPCVDILREVKKSGLAKKVIGFAAETEQLHDYALQKLNAKADIIIANQVGNGLGFGQCDSSLTVMTKEKTVTLTQQSKLSLARQLVEIFKTLID
jgi:phosphopantothenoylcysteine decarboxylase/phosphopantothenate--cysteine ligase